MNLNEAGISGQSTLSANFYYAADVPTFISAAPEAILGTISTNTDFSVDATQRNAWVGQIEILKPALVGLQGHIFLEFIVPRIGSRIDAVLITGPIIFVIEFKVGEPTVKNEDLNQVWDCALDLKNFHKASHHSPIFPILVATHALQPEPSFRYRDYGMLATSGRNAAVAVLGGLRLSGYPAWLLWLLAHIWYLIGFRNRLVVMIDWAWAYWTFARGARIVTGAQRGP